MSMTDAPDAVEEQEARALALKVPDVQWLRVGDLRVDTYTQRSYSPTFAKDMSRRWDDSKLGLFKVSYRKDGGYYVIDGQHRRGALLLLDQMDKQVPALVYSGLTLRDEASMFVADNNDNRRPNPLDVHRLLVVAEEPEAVAIQKILDEHRLTLAYGGNARSISAISALRWLYQTGGEKLTELTLRTVEEAWGDDSRDSRDGTLLRALGFVLHHKATQIDVTSLADKLGKRGKPGQLLGDARTYRQMTGRSLWLETAHAVVAVYNKGRHSRRVVL